MEDVVVKDAILDKKLNEWGYSHNDYVAQGEITVEITLREYRDLIENKAKSQYKIDEAIRESSEYKKENEELKIQIKDLTDVIYCLKNTATYSDVVKSERCE